MKIGIVSGYFNPLHAGHIDYINEAKKHCIYLIAIINNDDQVKIKGSREFMDEKHRQKIVKNIKNINETIISIDSGKNVAHTLKLLREKYPHSEMSFFNDGDRQKGNLISEESKVCKENNIKEVVLNQQKVYSSSELKSKLI